MPRQCQRLSVMISASGGCAKWLPPSQRIITNHWLCISNPVAPPPPAPPLLSKEVPSVSDSGASAIYSECSKQMCHFCIWRARVRAYYHWQGCLLSWEILSVLWYIPSPISIFPSRLHALFPASLKQWHKIIPHFHSSKESGQKSNTQESA